MPGYLTRGVWHAGRLNQNTAEGNFIRADSQFRSWVAQNSESPFRAEVGRYHLYLSYACPWAHRLLIARVLLQLQDAISISIVHPVSGDHGWCFDDYPGVIPDSEYGFENIYQLYLKSNPNYSGLATVPILWDKQTETIVNNESSEILRMMAVNLRSISPSDLNLFPEDLKEEIERIEEYTYSEINNRVYQCGFASTQDAYILAVTKLFAALDCLEEHLTKTPYLVGNTITEADIRLFPTLVRFDPVYFIHFKCSIKRISDYPALSRYMNQIRSIPGIEETINIDHIKRHYYLSHPHLNPSGIIPLTQTITNHITNNETFRPI